MTNPSSGPLEPIRIAQTLGACADAARPITLAMFRTQLSVDNKLDKGFDPVTAADRDAETAIRATIAAAFPDHSIIGEEWDAKSTASPYCWIVDPIDGTRAFITGVPVWGTLVGLTENGRAIAGLMEQPHSGERWLAVDGQLTATRHGTPFPARASGVTELAQARASTTSPEHFSGAHLEGWDALCREVLVTRYGLDCYAYCLLASGHLDLVVEAGLKNVDIAPLVPIIEAAGGVVSTWNGERAEQGGTCVAAATPQLHEQAMKILSDAMLR
ncbi:histidinol-phosphatase [Pelagibacterium lacus]|uniref:Histidinol-phosphatase n=1 Tax=Pelagibacterium lacus TaxID=2282655 RepID=A0A369W1H1_9HYPH|nr:histidinol-phosphatase [Pelagibacterium lacus]RDE08388.1 histidinol-phosphatase [Pelagibacterium lacus]